ncbi:hypothetical protein FZ103_04865 [Streptomonospora sp. PA3]|uniref:hypothetical protein n=1 Tax=Streptomonospora sp. PA3 TaxID=2607326 RepID=UPI0012DFBF05|nr:hypothetical protein [Streptomonospora sp. PA3]MUL40516.1 hypothetical protein [Streptomonospora sp. PA3]
MVDTELLITGLAVTLGGIVLVLLGGAAYIAYQALERHLDRRAGIPDPQDAPPADPSAGAAGEPAAGRREHQPA